MVFREFSNLVVLMETYRDYCGPGDELLILEALSEEGNPFK
jgi:hypothetical protein